MALPTPDKTYQYNVNQAIPASGVILTTNRRVLRAIKDSLTTFGSNPWTTRYSCNSVTAGAAGDGVDRWTADANLVWAAAGAAHSWYVFRNANIATNFELLLSLEGASGNGIIVLAAISPSAGFTGGTTTARPTATDEIIIINSNAYGGQNVDSNFVLHALESTDGQVTTIVLYVSNLPVAFWHFQKPKNPVTGWTNPSASWMLGNSAVVNEMTSALLWTAANGRGRGASTMNLFLTGEGYSGANLAVNQNSANDLSAEFPILPAGIASTTAANRGRHGQMFDVWWGLESNGQGDTYPNDATRQFAQFGSLVFPWNGSTPVTA